MVKITGTIINYYLHCKRQCWLFMKKINLEDNSEEVRIGRILHENKNNSEASEITIDNIKTDKITDKYIVEYKKSDADLQATIMQVKYYMYILNQKGIKKDGKIEIFEKNKQNKKIHYIENNKQIENEIEKLKNNIKDLYNMGIPPKHQKENKCKRCAYNDYCNL